MAGDRTVTKPSLLGGVPTPDRRSVAVVVRPTEALHLLRPAVRSALGREAGAIATDEHSRRHGQMRDAGLGENAAAAAAAVQARYRSERCGKRPHGFILSREDTSG